jgi:hypothetical protein
MKSTLQQKMQANLVILMAMWIWRYNAGHIAQWSTSQALLEAMDPAIRQVPERHCPRSCQGH